MKFALEICQNGVATGKYREVWLADRYGIQTFDTGAEAAEESRQLNAAAESDGATIRFKVSRTDTAPSAPKIEERFALEIFHNGRATGELREEAGRSVTQFFDTFEDAFNASMPLNRRQIENGSSFRFIVSKRKADPTAESEKPVTEDWRKREKSRFFNGEYTHAPWNYVHWYTHSEYANLHFVHISTENPGMVAFTESEEKGIADKQLRMKAGRYLRRFFGDEMPPENIAYWAGLVSLATGEFEVHFATTPDEIAKVYTEGPDSCMGKSKSHFDSSVHPCSVYGAGDLAIAYILNAEDEIASRVLCWPEKKRYVGEKIYGDGGSYDEALVDKLEAMGYRDNEDIDGAKLLRIEENGAFVCPYLDNDFGVDDYGCHLRVTGDCPEYAAQETNGLTQPTYKCDNCGENYDRENSGCYIESRDMDVCESCYSDITTSCDNCGDRVHDGDIESADDGSTSLCQVCLTDRVIACDDCGDNFTEGNTRYIESAEKDVCDSCYHASYFACDDCAEDFDKDESHNDNCYEICGACANTRAEEAVEGESPISAPAANSETGQAESAGQMRLTILSE